MNGRKGCKGCKYYRPMFSNVKGCHHCYDTGETRGCPVEGCDRHLKRCRGRPKEAVLYGKFNYSA